jgi:hypothetical protein
VLEPLSFFEYTYDTAKLAKAAKAPGKMGQRARLAQTLKGMKKK